MKNLIVKGNVKSMYSDYASGIAFLIKTKFNQNDTRGFEATETCVLVHCLFWCTVGSQAEFEATETNRAEPRAITR